MPWNGRGASLSLNPARKDTWLRPLSAPRLTARSNRRYTLSPEQTGSTPRCTPIRPYRRDPRPDAGPPVNERVLRYRDVRVIGSDGAQLGILQSRQALTLAREEGLDLVMVSATAVPPVCRIIDFGRHRYETKKLQKDHKSKQQDVKGIKISPRIAEHDLNFQMRKAARFLEEGHKVRVTCMFKAREVTHPELGRNKLDRFAEGLATQATVERLPALEGRMMIMTLNPVKQPVAKKHAKTENKQDGGEAVQDNRKREDHPPEVA
ncbi:MAG: translation initiation factor IF-3 [Fimbriimonas ginsengisoli]|uniref:Translation initiation factor IF-3 n=1 Tax=Fimbriimonas ginsengisoli TaxID=1005039 RepID=A0A931PTS1_FIMGI|nr:translation initiation factor IF-3 [Fimbriimonas ginsengisoli]